MASYIITFVLNSPKINNAQLNTIVNICINLGSISFGSIAVPFIFDKKFDLMLSFGLVGTLVFWYIAVLLSRKLDKNYE